MTTLVSLTRLRLRSPLSLPGFFLQAMRSNDQIQKAPGFLGGALLPDRKLTFWTMTLWENEARMKTAILSGAHRAVMPKLVNWCDEASVARWEQAGDTLPDWTEAERRMRAEARPSKVRRPSGDHQALTFAPPRVSVSAPLPPKL